MKKKILEYGKRQHIPAVSIIDILEIVKQELQHVCELDNGYPKIDRYVEIIKKCKNYDDAFDAGVIFAEEQIKNNLMDKLT